MNTALVVRNWLFGWYIVEFEQEGEQRAVYGKELLRIILKLLSERVGKGFSVDNLELMRKFYLSRPLNRMLEGKSETLSRISAAISETASRKLMIQQMVSVKSVTPDLYFHEIAKTLSSNLYRRNFLLFRGQEIRRKRFSRHCLPNVVCLLNVYSK